MEGFRRLRKTLGIVLVIRCTGHNRYHKMGYCQETKWWGKETTWAEWSKLELILEQIQNNYVDPVDVSAFIEKRFLLSWKS